MTQLLGEIAITTLKNASPTQALAAILATLESLPATRVALGNAHGSTLAQDIVAQRDQPPFPASAMDGYAVQATDTPAVLTLIGQSAAGSGFSGTLGQGQCVRIFTGAPVPDGADSVVIQEDVQIDGKQITIPVTPVGQHVRPRGIDFKAGVTLLKCGQILDPIALALVGATGLDQVNVATKPKIVILTGGDEIVSPGTQPARFQIYDSLTTALAALIRSWGGDAISFSPQRDTIEALESAYRDALSQADLVVTIGGASVGDRDLIKSALAAFEPLFVVDKIAVRPGKPTWFATTQLAPVLGLPGNPASALVCAHLFLRPILKAFLGQPTAAAYLNAKLTRALPANGPREHYLRARTFGDDYGQMWIDPCEDQDSSLLSVFQAATALVQCPAHAAPYALGDLVSFLDLARLG